ncbi:hypothetical protein E2562_029393 [Oryza meyeriana var. granulata]|uniref:Uncharacterized protein n=1 Tax=Oryza meyeriana var. granulata TaxID=110450 RepID=A0A6G1C182_9ORYZ|nr:hypothetical protein E2562_029393 [Oryza meyeriana var. granulata]
MSRLPTIAVVVRPPDPALTSVQDRRRHRLLRRIGSWEWRGEEPRELRSWGSHRRAWESRGWRGEEPGSGGSRGARGHMPLGMERRGRHHMKLGEPPPVLDLNKRGDEF